MNNINTTNTNTSNIEEEEINLRKIFVILLKNWYLFVIFGMLGIMGGYLASRYSHPDYQVQATIYVPAQKGGISANLEDMFTSQLSGNKAEVFNQIEIIKSFNINDQVARNLNWRTKWFKRDQLSFSNLMTETDIFQWRAFYKDAPFNVEEAPGAFNSPGVEIHLTPVSPTSFKLNIEGQVIYNGAKKVVKIETMGSYGQPFKNDYFNFTITPNGKVNEDLDHYYYFTFNDPGTIARSQLGALSVNLNDKQSEIIKLQIQGKSPERQIDYLNELINVYMQDKMSYQTETQKRSLLFIDSQLVGISDSLNSAGSNFTEFRSKNKIINIGEQGTQVMTNLMQIESERNKNQMQLDYFRNLLDYLGKSDDIKQLIAPSVVGIQDPALNTMVVKLSELYSRRQVLSFSANETNPTLLMIDKEIAQLNARLKENLRNLIQNAEVLNRSLDNQKSTINAQLNKLPAKEQDLINFQRRYDLTNEIYTFLLQKRSEINIALAGATPEVQVIDAARMETTSQVGLSGMSKIMIGLLVGLFLPALFLLVLNFFSDTIETQEDIQQGTHLPILGNVIHSRSKSDTPVNDNPRSGIAESYRSIRTNLQFVLTEQDKKVVAIHSTNPGEGKSFTSVNLATILAMNDKKVVLVGADMRKARLHKIFNLPNEKGLSTYLSGQDPLQDILHECSIDNLMIIPAGPVPPNPSELIDRPAMKNLLDELATRYDYIIVDNAPVSLVTDGLLAGRLAHLNIFILRYGISKKAQIKFINQLADNKVLQNISLVVNDIQGAGFGYYGGNYYYGTKYGEYGSGYYSDEEDVKKVHPIKKMFSKN
ncbi:MAG TPA: polysaccharide biosynthesis tyrosine autokinase [Prolixibacteraceae bacterium]|nr:polysaccharide biosynthesis tyrosine autokinase [Prolixibacteraceae bacterium]